MYIILFFYLIGWQNNSLNFKKKSCWHCKTFSRSDMSIYSHVTNRISATAVAKKLTCYSHQWLIIVSNSTYYCFLHPISSSPNDLQLCIKFVIDRRLHLLVITQKQVKSHTICQKDQQGIVQTTLFHSLIYVFTLTTFFIT